MLMDEEDIRIEESVVIQRKEKMDEHEALTGTIQIFRMVVYNTDDVFYVAYCLNGDEPKGSYFRKLGAARFRFELLKNKIP